MQLDEKILIISTIICVLSFFLAFVSTVLVIITLHQNNKLMEASTRPIMSVCTQTLNLGLPEVYLVVKNLGNSPSFMKSFVTDFDFTGCYKTNDSKNYIEEFSTCTFVPGQSRICLLDLSKINKDVRFTIEYRSSLKKTYKEEFILNLKSGSNFPYKHSVLPDKSISGIYEAIQEMILRNL